MQLALARHVAGRAPIVRAPTSSSAAQQAMAPARARVIAALGDSESARPTGAADRASMSAGPGAPGAAGALRSAPPAPALSTFLAEVLVSPRAIASRRCRWIGLAPAHNRSESASRGGPHASMTPQGGSMTEPHGTALVTGASAG